MNTNRIIQLAAGLGALAVGLGAFGAHGLKAVANAETVAVFETAVRYQFYHVFGLLAIAMLAPHHPNGRRFWARANLSFLLGILIFSGSLYLLSFSKVYDLGLNWLGAITPIGGLAFILGWVFILLAAKVK